MICLRHIRQCLGHLETYACCRSVIWKLFKHAVNEQSPCPQRGLCNALDVRQLRQSEHEVRLRKDTPTQNSEDFAARLRVRISHGLHTRAQCREVGIPCPADRWVSD